VLADLERQPGATRIMVVSHDAVILLFRYVLEGLSERQLLDVAAASTVLNASLTRYGRDGGRWTLESFNVADHLAEQGVALTEHGGDANVRPQ
jgi:broad specificity phosphatase PhoE